MLKKICNCLRCYYKPQGKKLQGVQEMQLKHGISESVVRSISKHKKEPAWMLKLRLTSLKHFQKQKLPKWGPDLSALNLKKIKYFSSVGEEKKQWKDVPKEIRETFEKLGIPEAERKALAGVGTQYESESVYHSLKEEWKKKGVIFENLDYAVQHYPELVRQYFMKCVPYTSHTFAALHYAVWSGGTFIYIPKGLKVEIPLQAYFRMNAQSMGQFEHTLIVVDEGADIHYIEGCFTRGNILTTSEGYIPIEEVKENQKVLTSEGVFKTAKDMQAYPYSGKLYTIEIYGDSTQKIEVTPEHLILYVDKKRKNERNKKYEPRWNIPKFFRKGDYLAVPINKKITRRKYSYFEIIKGAGRNGYQKYNICVPLINEFFRLVGYYLAEGSISSNSYLNFSFGAHEREYIEDVKHCLNKVFGVTKILEFTHKKNHGTSIVVCSAVLARIFKQFGNKNCNKALLPWMMFETYGHQKEIIKCWFRGDGNYYNKISKTSGWLKETFRINTTSEKLARQGRDILLRLGIVGFLNKRERTHDGRRTMYTLGITGYYLPLFGKIVGIPVRTTLNQKNRASLFGINKKFAFLPIKKITVKKVERIPVFNFGVTDHETYTVAGVAVHNCSAPLHSTHSLHAGCVEIFVKKHSRCRYSSVENWSKNVFNLNTKRAIVDDDGTIEWLGGNLGSCTTMLYPCSVLKGKKSTAVYTGIAFAGTGQNQDTGAKAMLIGEETSCTIKSKSISKNRGITTYRGFVDIHNGAKNAKAHIVCDALLLDKESVSGTVPYFSVKEQSADIGHEATTGKISEEKLFYLMSKGLSEEEAIKSIVTGFAEPFIKQLPLEYAVELNRLIELEIEK